MASDKYSSKRDKDRKTSKSKHRDDDKEPKNGVASTEKPKKEQKQKHKRELEALNDDSEQEKQIKRLRAYSKDENDDDQQTARRRTRSMDAKEEAEIIPPTKLTPDEWRKEHGITVQGSDSSNPIPDPFMEFTDAPFGEKILQGFKMAGFAKPTSIQSQSWPIALQGRDMISIAKTGSGKVGGADRVHP